MEEQTQETTTNEAPEITITDVMSKISELETMFQASEAARIKAEASLKQLNDQIVKGALAKPAEPERTLLKNVK